MNKRNISIGLGVLFIIGLIIMSIVYSLTPKATLVLALAPEEGFLSIDGGPKNAVKNKQNISIKPGAHTVEFSRDEFDPLSQTFTVDDKKSIEVIIVLNPLTEAAKKLLLTPGAQEVVQRFVGKKFIKESEQLDQTYPILSILPIEARLYTVNSCRSVKYPDDSTKIALCADMSEEGLESYILKDITSRGYNPSDYEIIFTNISNVTDWD